jgi:hypothetical protein
MRRDVSIRTRVRRMARQLGTVFGDDEATSLVRDAVDVYDARSALVHDGKLTDSVLSEAVEKGRETVRRLLQAFVIRMRDTATRCM